MTRTYQTSACVMMDARYIRDKSSGIGRYTEHLIDELLRIDDTLRLRLITHPSKPNPVEHERVTCEVFPFAPNSPLTRLLLAHRVDMEGVDLFHSPFNFLPADLPVPAVFTLHDIMWLLDPSFCVSNPVMRLVLGTMYRYLIPRSVAEASRLMTVSHNSREAIEGYFPEKSGKVHVTYNGVDPFFHQLDTEEAWSLLAKKVPPRRKYVLVVGQGSPYKNHEGALEAFIEAFGDADGQDVSLVMVRRFSRGLNRRMERLLNDPRVADRIIRLEYVTGLELRALYSQASAFLFPSLYEGFGLPPLEAMACGAPVIASNVGAPAEICGGGARLINPHDTAEIAAALREVVRDPEVADALRARGAAHAATFTWQRSAEQALLTYRRVLGLDEDDADGAGHPDASRAPSADTDLSA